MAEPVPSRPEFQVNTGTAATGTQSMPQIIGLANGNILIAWEEAADGEIATGAASGTDVVGKLYDAEGAVLRDSFRINGALMV